MKNLEVVGTVYYLTTDPDNGKRARDLAAAPGRRVEVLFPKDLPLRADAIALIVDLDTLCLDARGRRQWLAELAATPPAVPTFAHSYDFADEEGFDTENPVRLPHLDDLLLCRLAGCLSLVATTAA